jgi:hypothetical protein
MVSDVQKIKVRGCKDGGLLGKRTGGFIEDDMPGDDDFVGGKIKTSIAFVMS